MFFSAVTATDIIGDRRDREMSVGGRGPVRRKGKNVSLADVLHLRTTVEITILNHFGLVCKMCPVRINEDFRFV